MTMHINLSPEMEGFIKSKVNSGFYSDVTEVIRDAVRRLQAEEDRIVAEPVALKKGSDQLNPGEGEGNTRENLNAMTQRTMDSTHSGKPLHPGVIMASFKDELLSSKLAPPLAGVRVLEATTRLAGPFCASMLGEFGAEVIKIELPGKGDPFRVTGTKSAAGSSFNFLNDNRNKKAITLDLRKKKGAAIFKRLISDCDILVENFRPKTLEKWGVGYETLKSIKEDLIFVSISAYGQDGPYRDRPGVGRIAYGVAGIAYLTGEKEGPPLLPGTSALGDYLSGLYGALGALLAYIARGRSGRGQCVDATLYESVFRMLDELAPVYAKTGFVRERSGAAHPYSVPNNHYLTKDDHWVVIVCTVDSMFARLAAIMEQPDLPARFPTLAERVKGRDELEGIVAAWVRSLTRDELLRRCHAGDLTAGPINSIADIFADEHFRARNTLLEFDHPQAGKVVVPNVSPRLSATPGEVRTLGVELGQNNIEIYRDRLGFSEGEMSQLQMEGVI